LVSGQCYIEQMGDAAKGQTGGEQSESPLSLSQFCRRSYNALDDARDVTASLPLSLWYWQWRVPGSPAAVARQRSAAVASYWDNGD
jgi:hypothetical protein